MEGRLIPPLVLLVLIAAFAAGCGEKVPAPVPEGTAATTLPVTPVPETPAPTETAPPTPSATPEPFPGALSVGTSYRYGREDIAMEVTVYRVRVMDEYDWWSPDWGRYWNTTPKKGYHFLFAFIRLVNRGTDRALLPAPHQFVLHSGGNSYIETTERNNSLWIKGINVRQYEYSFVETEGWIIPSESNKVEGFILYEVPRSITPENSYVQVIFSSKAATVWRLG
jgi:hypothetical protein